MQTPKKIVRPIVKLFIAGQKASGKTTVAELVSSALEANGYHRMQLPFKDKNPNRIMSFGNDFHCVAIFEEE